jgi:glycosyltransferase involved in cell wall biosynthesis
MPIATNELIKERTNVKPKVLIIIATDIIGGPGKGLFQFFDHAPQKEFDYVLCNFNVWNKEHGQFVREALRRNLNIMFLDQNAVIDPFLVFRARKIILQNQINIIQTHGYKSNLIGFFLRRLYSYPWLGFAHGYTYDNNRMRLYNFFDRFALRFADQVVAVSNSMKELLVRNGVKDSKIRVLYNAIDPAEGKSTIDGHKVKKEYGIREDQKIIGVVGRLNPEKGQLVFLKAFRKVLKRFPSVTALIIGEGQDREELEAYCNKHEMRESVRFTGYQEKISSFYQILDILVLPSLSEGLPNTVLEAMSFGIPVVATSVGGVPEVINNENGILVPPGDHETLVDGITRLLQDDQLRRALGIKGKDSLYPRFSPSYRAQQLIELYKNLSASRAFCS